MSAVDTRSVAGIAGVYDEGNGVDQRGVVDVIMVGDNQGRAVATVQHLVQETPHLPCRVACSRIGGN